MMKNNKKMKNMQVHTQKKVKIQNEEVEVVEEDEEGKGMN